MADVIGSLAIITAAVCLVGHWLWALYKFVTAPKEESEC